MQGQRARATSSTAATEQSARFTAVKRTVCVTLTALHRTALQQSVDLMVELMVLSANSNSLLAVSRKISASPIVVNAEVCYQPNSIQYQRVELCC